MIIDKIENLKNYASVNPLFPKVVEFIEQHDLDQLELGKHEIVGKDLFAIWMLTKRSLPTISYLPGSNWSRSCCSINSTTFGNSGFTEA